MLSFIYKSAFDEALQMFTKGFSPEEILSFLVTAAEKVSGPDTVSSILLLDENGLLRNGASPKLPADYLKAIDGLRPNPNVGTCAAAAATGQPVVTPSFYADDKWRNFGTYQARLDLLEHGACLSRQKTIKCPEHSALTSANKENHPLTK